MKPQDFKKVTGNPKTKEILKQRNFQNKGNPNAKEFLKQKKSKEFSVEALNRRMKSEAGLIIQMVYSDMDTSQKNSEVAKFQKKRIEISEFKKV